MNLDVSQLKALLGVKSMRVCVVNGETSEWAEVEVVSRDKGHLTLFCKGEKPVLNSPHVPNTGKLFG